VLPPAGPPQVTNVATTINQQTTSGLVILPDAADTSSVTNFQISGITGGSLFLNNGTTPVTDGEFITTAQGAAGLKFTPTTGSQANGSFMVQEATAANLVGLSGSQATATITLLLPAGPPLVTTDVTTTEDIQTPPLVIVPPANDLALVTNFQITSITGGSLYLSDGVTPVTNSEFITVAEGAAGLKFTPTENSLEAGSFTIQESENASASGLAGQLGIASISVLPTPVVWTGAGDGITWSDPANWSGDNVPGPSDNVAINISGNRTIVYSAALGDSTVQNLSLGNGDTLSLTGGSLEVTNSLSVANATLTLASGALECDTDAANFTNVTFNVTQGANNTILSGTYTGVTTFNVSQGSNIYLEDGAVMSGTLTGAGAGTVQLSEGTIDIGLGGLTLNFSGGMFQWTGGAISSADGDLINLGTMNLDGSGDLGFYNDGTLDDFGTIIQTGVGNLGLHSDGLAATTLKIEPHGSYLIESDAGIDNPYGNQTAVINEGTIKKTTGNGVSALFINGNLNNTGVIEADSGTIQLEAISITQVSGSLLTGGIWNALNGATIEFPSGTSITSSAASITIDGASATITGITGLASNSGAFALTGGATFTTAAAFANSGALTLGAGSTLTVNGAFSQATGAALEEQIGGTPASGNSARSRPPAPRRWRACSICRSSTATRRPPAKAIPCSGFPRSRATSLRSTDSIRGLSNRSVQPSSA
jgi:hypothetical protein